MGSQQTLQPTNGLVTIPANYPTTPTPGKIEDLWDANYHKLYHALSPYGKDGNQSIGGLFNSEPFNYTFIDQTNQGLNALMKYDSRTFPIGSAPKDVIRVTKFLGTGNGILFLAKQQLLQTGNPYNETRVYNPTSPIVAAGMTLALGSVRPQRNFDTSAGLAGIFSSLIGSAIPSAIFGPPKINPPAGTVATALPTATLTTGGKGLLRAGTANRGLSHLQAAWPQTSQGTSLNASFGTVLSGLAASLFGNLIPQNQNGMVARSDEGAYGMMIGAGSTNFVYVSRLGGEIGFGQQWVAGGKTMRKNGQYPQAFRMFVDENGNPLNVANDDLTSVDITGAGNAGYNVNESTIANDPGFRYGDNIGTAVDENYQASENMVQFSYYSDPSRTYPTKQTDPKSVSNLNATLTAVLNDLKKTSGGLYSVDVPNDARVISSGDPSTNGYDRLAATAQKLSNPANYPLGVLKDYRNVRVVDDTLGSTVPSMRFPSAGNFDAMNTLTVLPANSIQNLTNNAPNGAWKSLNMRGWTNRQWNPYNDDQIAMYFYDVVNQVYIPFRAALKGINETQTANWQELAFIGRADRTFSYGGFNRNLSLNIDINISSIAELAPTWKRINYLMTLLKPANYTATSNQQNTPMNRFMVPPMVMITMGDMYKDQPVIIQSLSIVVPDDASWETNNEFNSTQWEYLASYISAPNVLYGQLPRQVNIAVGMAILEKERPIAGGANFGAAARTDDYSNWNTTTVPSGGTPNKLNQYLVYDVTGQTPTNS